MTDQPAPKFSDFTNDLEKRGYILLEQHRFAVEQGSIAHYIVRRKPGVTEAAATEELIIRHFPDDAYEIFVQRCERTFDATRIVDGVPADIKCAITSGLMADRDEFDAMEKAFGDYSQEDIDEAHSSQERATAWIENEK
ncbi:hypothetical protein [Erythrobacter aureus]|uniref:Uncharacterized protein n=1 Tax=Erythrobacter aureus TaxID=2182384 RepID=A0A345YJM4_9SPHN|nr:hypothetical protein [Erythrobacter aureus]AXK44126.1 hypothetical protein DVR09_16875 [Erythrobacter aureus]